MSEQRGHLGRDTVVVASQQQVSADLKASGPREGPEDGSEEVVILDLAGGTYYELDGVGARVWNLIQAPRSIDGVLASLLEVYEVEPERCEADLLALLGEMHDLGLIETRDG